MSMCMRGGGTVKYSKSNESQSHVNLTKSQLHRKQNVIVKTVPGKTKINELETNQELQLSKEIQQLLKNFRVVQENSLSMANGIRNEMFEHLLQITEILTSYEMMRKENQELRDERIEIQEIMNHLVKKSERVHQMTFQLLQENKLMQKCIILQAALRGAHLQMRFHDFEVLEYRKNSRADPALALPPLLPHQQRQEQQQQRTPPSPSTISSYQSEETINSFKLKTDSTNFQDCNQTPHLHTSSEKEEEFFDLHNFTPPSLCMRPPFRMTPNSTLEIDVGEGNRDEDDDEVKEQREELCSSSSSSASLPASPPNIPYLQVSELTIITDQFHDLGDPVLSSASRFSQSRIKENYQAKKSSAACHQKIRKLSEYLSVSTLQQHDQLQHQQQQQQQQYPLAQNDMPLNKLDRNHHRICSSLSEILAKENREHRLLLLTPKEIRQLTDQVLKMHTKGLSISVSSSSSGESRSINQNNHDDLHAINRSLNSHDYNEEEGEDREEEVHSSYSNHTFSSTSVEINWEFEFQSTCSQFLSDNFSFHGGVWRISLERDSGSLHRLRYFLSLQCLTKNQFNQFQVEKCQFILCSTQQSQSHSLLSPYVCNCPPSKGGPTAKRWGHHIGSDLFKYIYEGKIKIITNVEIRFQE